MRKELNVRNLFRPLVSTTYSDGKLLILVTGELSLVFGYGGLPAFMLSLREDLYFTRVASTRNVFSYTSFLSDSKLLARAAYSLLPDRPLLHFTRRACE